MAVLHRFYCVITLEDCSGSVEEGSNLGPGVPDLSIAVKQKIYKNTFSTSKLAIYMFISFPFPG